MNPGVTAVRLRDSVQKGSAKRGSRRFVKTTTTRYATKIKGGDSGNSFRGVQLDQGHGRKDKGPAADYVMEGETLYRNIPHRAGSEDVASWKMCVPKSLRETVLRENQILGDEISTFRILGFGKILYWIYI